MGTVLDPLATESERAGAMLPAALLGLAILEHAFMVLPVPATALWHWGLRSRSAPETPAANEPALASLIVRPESLSP